MAALGEVPFGRYYGSVDATPLFVDAGRRVLATRPATSRFGRRRCGRTSRRRWPGSNAHGDPDGDGFVEYARQIDERAVQPGLEGLARRDLPRRRHAGRGADRAVRGAGLRLRAPGGPRRRWPRRSGADGAGRAASVRRREELRARFDEAFWCEDLGTYALALDGAKQPCRVRSLERRALPLRRGIAAARAQARRAADPDRARRSSPAGESARVAPARGALQPDVVPQRLGLAARQRAHRARLRRATA